MRRLYLPVAGGFLLVLLGGLNLWFPSGNNQSPEDIAQEDLVTTVLTGSVLFEGANLALPVAIREVGQFVVVADAANDPALHIIRRADGALTSSIGEMGGGPGEFEVVWTLLRRPGDLKAVWIFDPKLQRLTRIEIQQGRPSHLLRESRLLHLAAPTSPALYPIWRRDGSILASGLFHDGRFGRFSPTGEWLGAVGRLPDHADQEAIPATVLQQAYIGHNAPHPSKRLFVQAHQYAGLLSIFDTNGRWVMDISVPFPFRPTIEARNAEGLPAFVARKNLKFGYISVAAGEEAIYALFSGAVRGRMTEASPSGRYVHVFGWDGQLRQVIDLQRGVFSIQLADDGRRLYALQHAPKPAVLEFSLSVKRRG